VVEMRDHRLRGEDRMCGLARDENDPAAVACVVCGTACIDPGSGLGVMCGICATRMAPSIARDRIVNRDRPLPWERGGRR
jgi:hypothetical protein